MTRRRKPIAVEQETLDAACADDNDPLGHIWAPKRVRHVRDGLGRLGTLDRETLEAFYLNGQSLIEMSDTFDAPIETITRRLHIARKRLAKKSRCFRPSKSRLGGGAVRADARAAPPNSFARQRSLVR